MKNYEFVTDRGASEVIDELAKQIGVDASGVVRHGLILAAQQFRRHDLVQKLDPTDCVGLAGVTNLQETPVGPDDLPKEPPQSPEQQNQQQVQTPETGDQEETGPPFA